MSGEGRSGLLPVGGMLLLSLITGGLLISQKPLRTERQSERTTYTRSTPGLEHVDARLWQDPFWPVYEHRTALMKGESSFEVSYLRNLHTLEALGQDIRTNTNLTITLVTVPGAPYAGASENRRRRRQAVISALGVVGYNPRDDEHIGYVVSTWQPGGPLGGSLDFLVPFEWFDKHDGSLLLVWLDEGALGRDPLSQVGALLRHLLGYRYRWEEQGGDEKPPTQSIRLRLIGPGTSTTLRHMLDPQNPPVGNSNPREQQRLKTVAQRMAGRLGVALRRGLADADREDVDRTVGSWSRELLKALKDPPTDRGDLRDWLSDCQDNLREILREFPVAEETDPGWVNAVVERWFNSHRAELSGRIIPLGKNYDPLKRLEIFSDRATALSSGSTGCDPSALEEQIDDALRTETDGARFYSTVLPDCRLAEGIVEELARRGVEGCDERIVLVGEWDTVYGRTFPDAFEKAAKGRVGQVVRATYLRGLDGMLPGHPLQEDKDLSNGDSTDSRGRPATSLELAAGRSRLDYLRRLATRIKLQDRLGEREQRGVAAIGVIGSDVYDKQLALQALHDSFPGAIFFTTDLDARLITQDWARNLVVVSTYGLELNECFQGGVPPFRDGYQTSTFLAIQQALGAGQKGCGALPGKGQVIDGLHPRVFEVSRSGALDITPSEDGDGRTIHPVRLRTTPTPRLVAAWSLAVLIAFVLVAAITPSLQNTILRPRPQNRRLRVALCGFLASTVVTTAVYLFLVSLDNRKGEGEPLLFFEGVSVWPTTACRIVAVFASAAFALYGFQKLQHNHAVLGRKYGVELRDWKPIGPWWRFHQVSISEWRAEMPQTEGAEVWARYGYLGRPVNRLLRILPMAGLYSIFSILLLKLLGWPFRPVRGEVASAAESVVLTVSIIATTILVFFVVDASRLTEQFIRALSHRGIRWGEPLKKIARLRKLDVKDIDGYFTIVLIGKHTETTGRLIMFPFIILLVLVLARNPYFDRWDWPPALIVIFVTMFVYLIASGIAIRRRAEVVRSKVLGRLGVRKSQILRESIHESHDKQIDLLRDEIETYRRGALSPWSESPVLQAISIPFGGVGVVALIEMLATLEL